MGGGSEGALGPFGAQGGDLGGVLGCWRVLLWGVGGPGVMGGRGGELGGVGVSWMMGFSLGGRGGSWGDSGFRHGELGVPQWVLGPPDEYWGLSLGFGVSQ